MKTSLVLFLLYVSSGQSLTFHQLVEAPVVLKGAPNASSLVGLTVVGYQGWFGTPNDDDNNGWIHWGPLKNGTGIEEDFWPDMTEFTAPERHVAPGYTNKKGSPAELFSSDCTTTVLRHFQWMEAYGIDGAAVQRFGVEMSMNRVNRRLNNTVNAAEKTDRVLYIEYDLSGMKEVEIVPQLTKDWAMIVKLGITKSRRYVHEGGLPVVGIFGFYMNRFSSQTAHAILDIFKKDGPNPAFVAGAGQWYWFNDKPTDDWTAVFHRMGSWSPWNMGNWNGNPKEPVAATSYWAKDKADMEAHGVMYMPEIYPGTSSAHRDRKPPGTGRIPRMKGSFLWEQFAAATRLKVQTAFVGMFDELDEGTQVLKGVDDPPAQAVGDIGYEGMPSDVYLCFVGKGTQMMRGEIPYNSTKPDCPSLTQPTIPTSQPTIEKQQTFTLQWEPAIALRGGGEISHYQILHDGVVRRTEDATTTRVTVMNLGFEGAGLEHTWRVRAINTLGNAGGWSLPQSYTASEEIHIVV